MVDEALSRMSLTEISEALVKREVSSQEVVRNSLEELEKRGPITSPSKKPSPPPMWCAPCFFKLASSTLWNANRWPLF